MFSNIDLCLSLDLWYFIKLFDFGGFLGDLGDLGDCEGMWGTLCNLGGLWCTLRVLGVEHICGC